MTVRVRIDGTFYDVTFSGAVGIGPGPLPDQTCFQRVSGEGEIRVRESKDQTPITPKCWDCGRDLVRISGDPFRKWDCHQCPFPNRSFAFPDDIRDPETMHPFWNGDYPNPSTIWTKRRL